MSVIIHRCPDCGHKDLDHEVNPNSKASCSYAWCPCVTSRRTLSAEVEPEVVPSWDAVTGAPIATITTPGHPVGGTKTCPCAACQALCDSLGGVA